MASHDPRQLEAVTTRLFDRWARWYDAPLARLYFNRIYSRVEALFRETGRDRLKPGATVLDVAAGTGELLARLAPDFPEITFVGLDLTPSMVEKAQQKTHDLSNVTVQIGNARNLPSADVSVDIILCTEAFHHFAEPKQVVAEFHRVLKPTGQLILVDPGAPSKLLTRLIALVARMVEVNHHVYSSSELTRLLESHNFIVRSRTFAFFNNFFVATRQ